MVLHIVNRIRSLLSPTLIKLAVRNVGLNGTSSVLEPVKRNRIGLNRETSIEVYKILNAGSCHKNKATITNHSAMSL
jgi:hypothetical protein